jgi:glycosyltransferase involved in cell wall biosynthesis
MIQVTDRLLGSTPEEAAWVLGELARRNRLALALHDIPQPAEGGSWYQRRRDAYAAMTSLAEVVVVASEHERDSLERCRTEAPGLPDGRPRVVVVPLPIEPHVAEPAVPEVVDVRDAEIAVLGYLYPGKGVEDVVAAAADLRASGRPVGVTCIGAAAEGHAEHASTLAALAQRAAVPFQITGFVPEHELRSRLRAVSVPVAPHRHISASGSINAWLEAGRRPISLPSPYARELAVRLPGALHVVDDLGAGILEALDHADRTWLGPDTTLGPSARDAAGQHADILEDLARDPDRTSSAARFAATALP